MIHFACIYCGKKFRVKDAHAGKKAKCSACNHTIRIPHRRKRRKTATSQDTSNPSSTKAARSWAGKTDKEIARLLKARQSVHDDMMMPVRPGDQARMAIGLLVKPLIPRYDDLTLFALSAAFLLLYLANFNTLPVEPIIEGGRLANPQALFPMSMFHLNPILSVLVGLGVILSLVSVFFTWHKPQPVKYLMLTFAVLATGGTGVMAGLVALEMSRHWLMIIFPVWNIINGATLLVLFRAGMMDADCIVDRKTSLWQVVVTFTLIAIIFEICQFGFKLHWTITYSICICYTMSLNNALGDLFGLRLEPLEEQTAS